jgi:hypothetical protein
MKSLAITFTLTLSRQSWCIVRIVMLFNRFSPIVFLRYDLTWQRQDKLRSALALLHGVVNKSFANASTSLNGHWAAGTRWLNWSNFVGMLGCAFPVLLVYLIRWHLRSWFWTQTIVEAQIYDFIPFSVCRQIQNLIKLYLSLAPGLNS